MKFVREKDFSSDDIIKNIENLAIVFITDNLKVIIIYILKLFIFNRFWKSTLNHLFMITKIFFIFISGWIFTKMSVTKFDSHIMTGRVGQRPAQYLKYFAKFFWGSKHTSMPNKVKH